MTPGRAFADATSLSDDVVNAFDLKEHRAFRRENDQVYAIVGTNRDLAVVSDTWFGRFDSQVEFQQVLTHILDLFREGRFRYWLADLRMLAPDFRDSERWLVSPLMPEMFKAFLRP